MPKSGIKTKTRKVFETSDGQEFNTLAEAEEHESYILISERLDDNQFDIRESMEEYQDFAELGNFVEAAKTLCKINELAGIK